MTLARELLKSPGFFELGVILTLQAMAECGDEIAEQMVDEQE